MRQLGRTLATPRRGSWRSLVIPDATPGTQALQDNMVRSLLAHRSRLAPLVSLVHWLMTPLFCLGAIWPCGRLGLETRCERQPAPTPARWRPRRPLHHVSHEHMRVCSTRQQS